MKSLIWFGLSAAIVLTAALQVQANLVLEPGFEGYSAVTVSGHPPKGDRFPDGGNSTVSEPWRTYSGWDGVAIGTNGAGVDVGHTGDKAAFFGQNNNSGEGYQQILNHTLDVDKTYVFSFWALAFDDPATNGYRLDAWLEADGKQFGRLNLNSELSKDEYRSFSIQVTPAMFADASVSDGDSLEIHFISGGSKQVGAYVDDVKLIALNPSEPHAWLFSGVDPLADSLGSIDLVEVNRPDGSAQFPGSSADASGLVRDQGIVRFSGETNGDYLQFAPASAAEYGSFGFTITFWMRGGASQATGAVPVYALASDLATELWCEVDAAGDLLFYAGGSQANLGHLDPNQWQQYVIASDPAATVVYINGINVAEILGGLDSIHVLNIGGTDGAPAWNGDMDNVELSFGSSEPVGKSPLEIAAGHFTERLYGEDVSGSVIQGMLDIYDQQSGTYIVGDEEWRYAPAVDIPVAGPVGTFGGALNTKDAFLIMGDGGDGITLINPYVASNPSPADKANGVQLQGAVLDWDAGELATQHAVYLSTNINDVIGATPASASYLETVDDSEISLEQLQPGTTYYWAVNEINPAYAGGEPPLQSPWPGNVWQFKTTESTAVVRLNGGEPLIDLSDPGTGGNINGPKLIRVPDWIPAEHRADPAAQYYLYYAHHDGDTIRMAWASDIEGPYTFWGHPLHIGNADTPHLDVHDHIASPDIVIDNVNQKIILYFHGHMTWDGLNNNPQSTAVAISDYGLDFNNKVLDTILGPFYYKVFRYGGELYAFANQGKIYKAPDPEDPFNHPGTQPGWTTTFDARTWIEGPQLNPTGGGQPRHSAVWIRGDVLHWFFSEAYDAPEHIEYATIDLTQDWMSWQPSATESILKPELDWEGADLPNQQSNTGYAINVRQLRDPAVFIDDDGTHYLLYTGEGEEGIGLARFTEDWLTGKRADYATSGRPLDINDTTPPTAPTDLTADAISESSIELDWTAATDEDTWIDGYKIYRDGVEIGASVATSFTDTGLSDQTAYTYAVTAINASGLEGPPSNSATQTTLSDETPPVMESVQLLQSNRLEIRFSEPVGEASAETVGNYAVNGGVNVTGATLQADLMTVKLNLSGLATGMTYTLTVNGILDRATIPNMIAPNSQWVFDDSLILKVGFEEYEGAVVVSVSGHPPKGDRFPDGGDSTIDEPWRTFSGWDGVATGTNSVGVNVAHSGNKAAFFGQNNNSGVGYQQVLSHTLDINQTYTLSFWALPFAEPNPTNGWYLAAWIEAGGQQLGKIELNTEMSEFEHRQFEVVVTPQMFMDAGIVDGDSLTVSFQSGASKAVGAYIDDVVLSYKMEFGLVHLSTLANNWLRTDCLVPADCFGANLDDNTRVDMGDFDIMSEYWTGN